MTTETTLVQHDLKPRLNGAGWGLLLAWTGVALLLPGELGVLWNTWLLGVGVILLGAGGVGLALGLKPTWVTIVLGVLGVASGTSGLASVPISTIGLALILFGLVSMALALKDHVPTAN
jgi:hypothetical protein